MLSIVGHPLIKLALIKHALIRPLCMCTVLQWIAYSYDAMYDNASMTIALQRIIYNSMLAYNACMTLYCREHIMLA